ncbi:MAG: FG-GAP repeat protein [Bacteroidetes bacterium]|nr:FG-GAP repeat protein [Bacteroidota bacterium]
MGAYFEDENASGGATLANAGSAYIFTQSAGVWAQQQKIVAADRAGNDNFGYSVAMSGNYAIVGAYLEDENASGRCHGYAAGSAISLTRRQHGAQQQKIVATDRAAGDWFGTSVAISGDYAIVGAQYEDENASGGATASNAGSAYIFNKRPVHAQQQK